ncbi:NB-ARC domain-containing protein [Streptomyces sp. DH7]|uniref:NB-ARC domain-containing protein n=1 Tax=Streptomyces sp. DH7 TaxID=2857006 RepID=UPI001E4F715A|nr:NB-ARC domain-containing protein [Streptomyces sp. DH7]
MRRFVSKWIVRGPLLLGALAFLAWTVLRKGWGEADPVASVMGVVIVLVLMIWPRLSPTAAATAPAAPGPVAVPDGWVDRAEADQVVTAVLARTRRRWQGGDAVAITAGLHGAGGFGKTTLARFAAAQPKVRKRFPGGIWFITIGRDVRGRAAIAAKVAEEMKRITGVGSTAGDDPEQAGAQLGELLASLPRTLLVIDDVWEEEQLRPFLIGAERRCVRLITTRSPKVLPAQAARITVDRMTWDQALLVLTQGLPQLPEHAVMNDLVEATGRWVLLLRIANRVMHEQMSTGVDANVVARRYLDGLRMQGPAAGDAQRDFDLNDTDERNRAVRASLAAATELLPDDGEQRFAELGVFAEDEAVPIALVARLWEGVAGLDEATARSLCRQMADLSLLSLDPSVPGGTVALHDVIRDHLRAELAARLPVVNAVFLDTITSAGEGGPEWWTTPHEYLRSFLIAHLVDAERIQDAVTVATDFRWVSTRLHHHGPTAPIRDLSLVPHADAATLASHLERAAHLLTPATPPQALDAVLRSRVPGGAAWLATADGVLSGPVLVDRWAPPDLPSSALLLTLTHQAPVGEMVLSPDGSRLATVETSGRVRIWDASSGAQVCELPRRSRMTEVAFSNGGAHLLTIDGDGIVYGWDLATGSEQHRFFPGECRSIAFSADGSRLFTGLEDGAVTTWETSTGARLNEYQAPISKLGRLLVSQDGTTLVFSRRGGLRAYSCDAHTGSDLQSLQGRPLAVTADGTHVATAQGGSVGIWSTSSGARLHELRGCHDITVASFNADGAELAVGNREGVVEVWDLETRTKIHRFHHGSLCSSLGFSPDGLRLTSASMDRTVRIWNLAASSPQPQEISVSVAAISADGSHVATVSREGFSVWDAARGAQVQRFARGDGAAGQELWFAPPFYGDQADLLSVAFTVTGVRFAAATDRDVVGVWDSAGTLLVQLACAGPLEKLALSPLGDLLVTVDRQGIVSVWDTGSGRQMHQLSDHRVRRLVFSPDGSRLATHGHSYGPSVWDTTSGTQVAHPARRSARALALAFSPDNSQVAIADGGVGFRVVDIATEAVIHRFRGTRVRAAAFSPDGKYLAGVGNDTISVWDSTTGERLTCMRADSDLESVIWHPDSRALFVGGRGVLGYEFMA